MGKKTWNEVPITGLGTVVLSGTLLLPQNREPISTAVVKKKTGRGSSMLLPAGLRTDPGAGAVLPGDLLSKLGGAGAIVQYRPARRRDIIRYRPWILAKLVIALFTAIAGVFAGINAYVAAGAPTTPAFTSETSVWVLAIAFLLVVLNLISDIRAATKKPTT